MLSAGFCVATNRSRHQNICVLAVYIIQHIGSNANRISVFCDIINKNLLYAQKFWPAEEFL